MPHPLAIDAVGPGHRRVPSRVRVFIDFLAEACASELLIPTRPEHQVQRLLNVESGA